MKSFIIILSALSIMAIATYAVIEFQNIAVLYAGLAAACFVIIGFSGNEKRN